MALDHYYESADGLRLYAALHGDRNHRTPILCLPGLTRNSRDFADLAEHLSLDRFVVCADQRGRGRSQYDPNWENYHPETYVGDMVALLQSLEIDRAIFIGTSLGGLMTMILNAFAGDRVAAAVINDIGPEVEPTGVARIQSYAGKTSPVTTWEGAARQIRDLNETFFPDYGDDDWHRMALRTYRDQDGKPVADYDPNISKVFSAADGASPPDLWPVWGQMAGKPVLVIRGEWSDILSANTYDRMLSEVESAQGVIVPERGHAPMLDEATALSAVEAFLTGLS